MDYAEGAGAALMEQLWVSAVVGDGRRVGDGWEEGPPFSGQEYGRVNPSGKHCGKDF